MTSTSLTVSWSPPPEDERNDRLLGYELRWQMCDDDVGKCDSPQMIRSESGSGQMLLKNLRRWSLYRITVAVVTVLGRGPESSPVHCRTDEDGKV